MIICDRCHKKLATAIVPTQAVSVAYVGGKEILAEGNWHAHLCKECRTVLLSALNALRQDYLKPLEGGPLA
jgi:hypothetical protein